MNHEIWIKSGQKYMDGLNVILRDFKIIFLPVRMMIFLEFLISSTTSCNVLTFANFFLRGGSETMFKIIFHRVNWSKWSGMTVSTSPRISLSNSLKLKQKLQFINYSSDQTNPDSFIFKGPGQESKIWALLAMNRCSWGPQNFKKID